MARVIRFVLDRFLLVPAGALIALIWANTAGESYFRMSHALAFAVNEIGMTLFLALIAQEVADAVLPGGELHDWRQWGIAATAAAGGILGAVGVFLWWVHAAGELLHVQAWPVVIAVDIAAGYYLLKLLFPRDGLVPLFLLIAVLTDATGLAVVFVRPPAADLLIAVVALATAIALAAGMRRAGITSFLPYFAFCGFLSWWAFYWTGLHPALAMVPIVPFLPHHARKDLIFADTATDTPAGAAEHRWRVAVQVVLFLFGLVNAGVLLRHRGTGSWAMLAGALVGRPLGIMAGAALGMLVGFRMPRREGWRSLLVLAAATSSGFTFTLLFASGVLAMGPMLAEIKIGALLTVIGAGLAWALAWGFGLGRFALSDKQ